MFQANRLLYHSTLGSRVIPKRWGIYGSVGVGSGNSRNIDAMLAMLRFYAKKAASFALSDVSKTNSI